MDTVTPTRVSPLRSIVAVDAATSDLIVASTVLVAAVARGSVWERVARVHGEFFRDVRPANTVAQVVRFIDPEWLVEVEADAVVED